MTSGNYVELLGRLADLSVAHAAFEAAVARYPDKRICIRDRVRVIWRSDKPRGWTQHEERKVAAETGMLPAGVDPSILIDI
jgi:hypothetical protein